MSVMSESAANVNPFFLPPLHKTTIADTLLATGVEDKALLGSNLSANSGAKTRLGFGTPSPSGKLDFWDWHESDKSQRSGDGVPRETFSFSIDSFRPFRLLADSALSSETCLRPQPLHEPIPLTGCRNHYSASWARPTAALTRASTKEPGAGPVARDKPPAW